MEIEIHSIAMLVCRIMLIYVVRHIDDFTVDVRRIILNYIVGKICALSEILFRVIAVYPGE